MITSTNLSLLRNLEYFQVMSNVLAYLKAENLEELKLASLAASFELKMKAYDEVLVLERGNALSEKLIMADRGRDNALRALIGIVRIYISFPDSEKADAASKLLHTIEKYGPEVDKMSYMQESGALTNMLEDLSLEESVAAITLLHLEDWVGELRAKASEFNDLFMGRESDNSTKLSGLAKEARVAVQTEFDHLVTLVNAYELVYGAEAYASLSAKVNEAVRYAQQQNARRGSRPAKSSDKPVAE